MEESSFDGNSQKILSANGLFSVYSQQFWATEIFSYTV